MRLATTSVALLALIYSLHAQSVQNGLADWPKKSRQVAEDGTADKITPFVLPPNCFR